MSLLESATRRVSDLLPGSNSKQTGWEGVQFDALSHWERVGVRA
jgi:hypothetical protein